MFNTLNQASMDAGPPVHPSTWIGGRRPSYLKLGRGRIKNYQIICNLKTFHRPILAITKNYVAIGSMVVALTVLLYFSSSGYRIISEDLKSRNVIKERLLRLCRYGLMLTQGPSLRLVTFQHFFIRFLINESSPKSRPD